MAKTSVKARQKKRERMVTQYAEKRKELKKAGDWKALDDLPKKFFKSKIEESLPDKRPSERICKILWYLEDRFA